MRQPMSGDPTLVQPFTTFMTPRHAGTTDSIALAYIGGPTLIDMSK